ncbi:unnamed protein product [Urochloa decumbens]|uniref:Uncharacterized protein n=1 Tax=Urochloa decumbens TaxID=240449 RepID=A0ABC9DDZ0_9POAL
MAARRSVLHVISLSIEHDEDTGEDKMLMKDGSSFVMKVNHQSQESILLTCAHVLSGDLIPAAPPLRFARDDPTFAEGIAAIGYCDTSGRLNGFSAIPAIKPGRIRGTVTKVLLKRIRLYHLMVSCVGMKGMSGGPIVSRRGVVGMLGGEETRCTYSIHRTTIYALLKRFVGVPRQAALTMDDVINLL